MESNKIIAPLENVNKLTKEDIALLQKTMKSAQSEDAKFIEALPSNNGVLEAVDNTMEDITEDAIVNIDPNTGTMITSFQSSVDDKLAAMLDINIEELYKLPETASEIPYDVDLIKSNAGNYGLKDADIAALLPIIDKFRAGEDLNWYNLMPEAIKVMITKECIEVNNHSMSAKKLFASELISGLIRDAGIDKIAIDLQEITNNAFDISGIMNMTLDYQKTVLETKFQELYSNLEAEGKFEKAKTIQDVSNAYKQSYTYENFITAVKTGKLKVKQFDIDKYKRYVSEFNYKYEKDTPFVINDISGIAPVLRRKLPQFEVHQIIKFIIAFCKYCNNLDSKSVVDHTYMSYTIINIMNLDLIVSNQEENAFTNTILANLNTAIEAVNNI